MKCSVRRPSRASRARRSDARLHLDGWIANAERHRQGERTGIFREPRAARRVIVAEHEAANRVTLGLPFDPTLGADDGRDLGRYHVTVRVHRHQKSPAF